MLKIIVTAQLFQLLPLKKAKIMQTRALHSAVSLQDVKAFRPDPLQSVKFFILVRQWVSDTDTHAHGFFAMSWRCSRMDHDFPISVPLQFGLDAVFFCCGCCKLFRSHGCALLSTCYHPL